MLLRCEGLDLLLTLDVVNAEVWWVVVTFDSEVEVNRPWISLTPPLEGD